MLRHAGRRSRWRASAVSAARTLFAGAIYAPLVMPEVILGLSLLLLFVALGVERGFWTIVAAHATFSMCFVAVVVRAGSPDFDRALEEAAMDLGAGAAARLLSITLPLIAPAIVAGFLLAFTLSLDDLVIASFTSGPGSTTLPMRDLQPGAARRLARDQCDLDADAGSVGLVLLFFALLSRGRVQLISFGRLAGALAASGAALPVEPLGGAGAPDQNSCVSGTIAGSSQCRSPRTAIASVRPPIECPRSLRRKALQRQHPVGDLHRAVHADRKVRRRGRGIDDLRHALVDAERAHRFVEHGASAAYFVETRQRTRRDAPQSLIEIEAADSRLE